MKMSLLRIGHARLIATELAALLMIALPMLRAAETPEIAAGSPLIYKQAEGCDLKLFVEKPAGWKPGGQRPAIVFFFGGGWVGGTPNQFLKESQYFARRGMVGIRVEYRTIPKGDPGPPMVCCEDAKSAMRYVRSHAVELGIDPRRIAAAGGSAGGHLAAFTGLVIGMDDPHDDLAVSCKPEALVLWNPVFNNGPGNYGYERLGGRYREFSPADNITSNAPPAIVFFGTQDKHVSVATAKAFQAEMEHCGVRCESNFYEGQAHGFFNKEPWLSKTLAAADQFLTSLGWLDKTTGKFISSKQKSGDLKNESCVASDAVAIPNKSHN